MRGMLLVFMLLTAVAVGCGGDGDQVMEATVPPAEAQMQSMLTDIVKEGEPLGSGGMILQEGIDSIRERDPAKADALQEEFDNLISATQPAAVKKHAQSMLEKL